MSKPISKAELSRHLGVTRTRVSALVKRGLPVRPNGKVDLADAVNWMKLNCEQIAAFPDRGINKILANDGDAPPAAPVLDDDQAVMDFAAAKALRETYLARTARCAYLAQAGKLLDSELVEREWTADAQRLESPHARGGGALRIPAATPQRP